MSSWYNYGVYTSGESSSIVSLFEEWGFRVYEVSDNVVKGSINARDIDDSAFNEAVASAEEVELFVRLKSNDNSGSVNINTFEVEDDTYTSVDSEYVGEDGRHSYIYSFKGIIRLKPDKKYV